MDLASSAAPRKPPLLKTAGHRGLLEEPRGKAWDRARPLALRNRGAKPAGVQNGIWEGKGTNEPVCRRAGRKVSDDGGPKSQALRCIEKVCLFP